MVLGELTLRSRARLSFLWMAQCGRRSQERRVREYGILEDLFTTNTIALDDIGAEHGSPFVSEKLCQVLSRRERLYTVVTTNIAPEHWPTKMELRVADRLMRNSVQIDLSEAESYALV
jgi:DNA replication protein DnaC